MKRKPLGSRMPSTTSLMLRDIFVCFWMNGGLLKQDPANILYAKENYEMGRRFIDIML